MKMKLLQSSSIRPKKDVAGKDNLKCVCRLTSFLKVHTRPNSLPFPQNTIFLRIAL